jgi:hypothetical protein
MIYSAQFTAFLDANVLYPAPVRDILLYTAYQDLYTVKWSDQVNHEWSKNLLKNRADLKTTSIEETIIQMNSAFPDANVFNYKDIISGLSLPDKNDRHVLAAAIKCKADVIVSFNLKHFPEKYLSKYEIEAKHPDEFLLNLYDMDHERFAAAFLLQVSHLRNPPKTCVEVLATLKKCNLPQIVMALEKHLQNSK